MGVHLAVCIIETCEQTQYIDNWVMMRKDRLCFIDDNEVTESKLSLPYLRLVAVRQFLVKAKRTKVIYLRPNSFKKT